MAFGVSRLSAPLQTDIRNDEAVDVVEITLPESGSPKWLFGPAGVDSEAFGGFEDRVVDFKPIGGRMNVDGWLMWHVETGFTLDDRDRKVSNYYSGEFGAGLSGAACRILLIGPSCSAGDEFVSYAGLLRAPRQKGAKSFAGDGGEIPFTVEPDLRAMRSELSIPKINRQDHPFADESDYGTPLVVPYGEVFSSVAGNGAIRCVKLGDVSRGGELGSIPKPWRYACCFTRASEVVRIYKDGVEQGAVSSDDWFYEVRNGNPYTEIGFDTDQGTSQFSVDLRGVTTDAQTPSSGTLITRPDEVYLHAATNFGFGAWNDDVGAWLATSSAPIQTSGPEGFDRLGTYFSTYGHVAAREVAGGQTLEALSNDFAKAFRFPMIWSEGGLLGVGVDSPFVDVLDDPDAYRWVEGQDFDAADFRHWYSDELVRGEIVDAWMQSQGSTHRESVVAERRFGSPLSLPGSMLWSPRD